MPQLMVLLPVPPELRQSVAGTMPANMHFAFQLDPTDEESGVAFTMCFEFGANHYQVQFGETPLRNRDALLLTMLHEPNPLLAQLIHSFIALDVRQKLQFVVPFDVTYH